MREYHKIQTVFKRDMNNRGKTLLDGQWSIPEFGYLSKNKWTFTEKVDGTNIRVMRIDEQIRFGGKTNNASLPPTLTERLQERFSDGLAFCSAFSDGDEVCLYGEGYGPKIQSGGKYRIDQDFVLFDVKIGDWWLNRVDVEDVAEKMGVDVVPVIGSGTLLHCIELVKHGMVSQWGDFQAEGIVARPEVELFARNGQRIIAKVKARDF